MTENPPRNAGVTDEFKRLRLRALRAHPRPWSNAVRDWAKQIANLDLAVAECEVRLARGAARIGSNGRATPLLHTYSTLIGQRRTLWESQIPTIRKGPSKW